WLRLPAPAARCDNGAARGTFVAYLIHSIVAADRRHDLRSLQILRAVAILAVLLVRDIHHDEAGDNEEQIDARFDAAFVTYFLVERPVTRLLQARVRDISGARTCRRC